MNRGQDDNDARALAVFDRWYAAHESSDLAALGAALADDVEIHSLFQPNPVRGRVAALKHFQRTTTTFGSMAMTLAGSPATSDGRVLVEVVFSGYFTGNLTWQGQHSRGTGQPFTVPGVAIVHVDGERVTSVRTLFDRTEWLAQIGLATDRSIHIIEGAEPDSVSS